MNEDNVDHAAPLDDETYEIVDPGEVKHDRPTKAHWYSVCTPCYHKLPADQQTYEFTRAEYDAHLAQCLEDDIDPGFGAHGFVIKVMNR